MAVSRVSSKGFSLPSNILLCHTQITVLEGNSHLSNTTCVLKEETQFDINSAGGSLERTRYLLQKVVAAIVYKAGLSLTVSSVPTPLPASRLVTITVATVSAA